MKLPTATYRLQLREGMDFARARDLVPYLDDLGVSHLYLSPIFTAAPGSTHGYDVTDPNEIEPSLGGRAGLEALSEALAARGMGLIIDIVPNHMAFTVHNVWLRHVLANGPDSRYARHFDIDWDAGPLPLPWLSAPFAELAEAGEVRIEGDEMVAGDLRVPLAAPHSGDVGACHEAQCWRLTHWRTEASAIAHRRFFTVTGLIGLRVEDEAVFEDVHRLTFDLIDAGIVHGLRVDHVDGLADPAAYLDRLRARLPDTPVWVEKILTGDEALPPAWPIQGTTGYEAARAIARVLTDAEGAARLAEGWPDFHSLRDDAKTQVVETELPAELERLTDLAEVAGAGLEWGRSAWRAALLAYVRAFPRYRTYLRPGETPEADAALVRATAEAAAHPLAPAVSDLAGLILDPANAELRSRLQQLTGAAIAKAQEDTAFYRWTPLLSANEVGAEPDEPALDAAGFHAAMARRQAE
jgi:(1->4)-alpha-D-glucan 1-alpha-D-glucosylmutase